jgi:hypothetical protein
VFGQQARKSGQQSSKYVHEESHEHAFPMPISPHFPWHVADGFAPHVPDEDTHWPAAPHVLPLPHVPHEPPQPSSPHDLPAHDGVHVPPPQPRGCAPPGSAPAPPQSKKPALALHPHVSAGASFVPQSILTRQPSSHHVSTSPAQHPT